MTMPSSMKSTADSATFFTPLGTRLESRLAMMKIAETMITDSHIRITTLFTANGPLPQMSGHSMAWLTGGNSMPKITRARPPWCRQRPA